MNICSHMIFQRSKGIVSALKSMEEPFSESFSWQVGDEFWEAVLHGWLMTRPWPILSYHPFCEIQYVICTSLQILKEHILPHDFLVEQGHSASPKNVWRELFLKAFHGRCWTNLGELFYMENSWSDYAKDGGVSQMHFPVT